ncbi:MAG: heparinase II/III family protein [Candidatus Latescibacteria bacterium]|nr:heparinase II/III family protein [Candidatus Latescibacterota bacterium]
MRRTTAKDIGRVVGIAALAIPGVVLSVLAVWMLRSVPAPALLLAASALLLVCKTAHAQPRTMYRPGDIANARENVKRFGWAADIASGFERSVALAMRQDRAFFDAFIPELTPGTHYGQNCPHCVGRLSLMGSGRFTWRIEDPDRISCIDCGTVYPNEQYPETGVLDCPHMGQRFTFYQTPEEVAVPENRAEHALKWLGDQPTMTSFTGHIRDRKVGWAYGQALMLAKLYALTGEIGYAERAAWILDRFARVFPNYLYHSYDGSVADLPPAEVAANMGKEEAAGGSPGGRFPRGAIRHAYGLHQFDDHSRMHNGFWGAGRMSVHGKGSDAGALIALTVAFDLIRDAAHPDGRPVLDEEMERRILEDLILAGCTDMEHWNSLSNKATAVFALSAAVGMLMEQPERVRHALDGFHRMLEGRYHHDGFYAESPSYGAHNLANMYELTDLLQGYSDPSGYRPDDGERIERLDLFSSGRFHLSLLSQVRMLAPGNRMPVIGDTRYDTGADLLSVDMLAARLGGAYAGLLESVQGGKLSDKGTEYALWYRPYGLKAELAELPLRSEWFPGWHVGVLRGARKAQDTALFLNGNEHQWTVQTGHRQQDVLSLSIYAYGEELASDRGYFSGSRQLLPDGRSGQAWTKSSFSHNLVVVDEEEQATRACGTNLELFGQAPGIEVVQASGVNVYPQCEAYRRTCVMVTAPGGGVYIVDLFRVKGGRIHQYAFHCNGSPIASHSTKPAPQPTEVSEAWGTWLENPHGISPEKSTTFAWQFRNVNLDLTLLNIPDRVVVADAPGWRVSTTEELAKPAIRQILAENRAGDENEVLASRYAAVIAPYRSEGSPVKGAQLLLDDAHSGALAVQVKLKGRTDYIGSTLDQTERRIGPVAAAGEFAFVSVDDRGEVVRGYLLNGTVLTCGDLQISLSEAANTLAVRSVDGRTYHLTEQLEDPEAVLGAYMLAGDAPQTGFEIESATEDAITVRDYPAIPTETVTILNSRWAGTKD